MIYEESEITDLLNCDNCLKPYDESYPPKILPCCHKTICFKCVHLTEQKIKNNKYNCIACNKEETMPDRFIVNQLAVKLIAKKPKEISRGNEVEKLKQNIRDIEEIVNKLIFETENGEDLITEDCNELKRQVQLAKEERIEEINKHCDALFIKINIYEKTCKSRFKEKRDQKQKAYDLIKSVNDSIQQQREYLRQLMIDDNETIECNQKMDELKKQIEKERKNVKKSILGNQIIKFEANKTDIHEEILGKLINLKFDFTKILVVSFTSIKLLDLNTNKCLKTFLGHSNWVKCVQLLHENQIVTCSEDKTIKIWDKPTRNCIKTLLGHSDIVWYIAILSNSRIISCSSDKSIRIWDVESGDCIKILNGHTKQVYTVVKHSNECILSGSADHTIKLWNAHSGECLKTYVGHQNSVFCVEILSNERILSGSGDKTIKIWNINTGDCLQTLIGHMDYVRCIKILSEERIISGSEDGELKIWCLKTNSCIQTINAHSKIIREIQILSDNQVASCSYDKRIKIWDLTSSSCIKKFQCEDGIDSIRIF